MIKNQDLTKQLPNFILAGFPKCATTSIAKYLEMHPSICFSNPKEPNFFLSNGNYTTEQWKKYSNCFSHLQPNQIIGEGTQRYTMRDRYPNVARDIYHYLPSVKLIFIARNPEERFISHFKMIDRDVNLKININDVFKHEWLIHNCVNTSKFFYQIKPYLDFFPQNNIWIGFYEDFIKDRSAFLKGIFDFLDVKNININQEIILNTSARPARTSFLYETLNNNPVYNFTKKLLPKEIRDRYRKLVRVRFNANRKYKMTSNFREKLLNEIQDDAYSFLKLAGKSPDFWELE